MPSLLQLIASVLAVYVGWRLLRPFVVKSPLDNIPGTQSDSFLWGNILMLFGRKTSWAYSDRLAAEYGRLFTFRGMLSAKMLYTFDPRALHSIYVKDQDVFEESENLLETFKLFLGPGLLATIGNQHRRQRKMLNPLFSAKHLREMTPIFNSIIHKLQDAISARVVDGTQEIDVLGWMGRAALELVGQGGLGHSFDPLIEDKADEFAENVKAYFPSVQQLNLLMRQNLHRVVKIGPSWFRRGIVEILPHKPSQRLREIADSLHERSLSIVNEKKAALEKGDEALREQVGEGKDIMSVLLRANMAASEEDRLPDEEVVAQVSTFVLAGMDTTSNALARILHLLTLHPAVQDKVREEIVRARDDGTGTLKDLDYDEVMELPYLDAVCRETLRRYPPVRGLLRIARKDGILPLSAPIRGIDGTLIESIPVKKGSRIFTDISASNRNKELWGPDADEWKPERWLNPLPRALEEAHIPGVYSHLMTFIGGSRACIGFKFSQLEMKVVLAMLLPAFKFELSDKPIYWNAAGVNFPSVGEDSIKPEMPLLLTRLQV
ncbi:cytochrome P450 [Trametes elegans]|nr:cytochrome P450 [Trametes elegans]